MIDFPRRTKGFREQIGHVPANKASLTDVLVKTFNATKEDLDRMLGSQAQIEMTAALVNTATIPFVKISSAPPVWNPDSGPFCAPRRRDSAVFKSYFSIGQRLMLQAQGHESDKAPLVALLRRAEVIRQGPGRQQAHELEQQRRRRAELFYHQLDELARMNMEMWQQLFPQDNIARYFRQRAYVGKQARETERRFERFNRRFFAYGILWATQQAPPLNQLMNIRPDHIYIMERVLTDFVEELTQNGVGTSTLFSMLNLIRKGFELRQSIRQEYLPFATDDAGLAAAFPQLTEEAYARRGLHALRMASLLVGNIESQVLVPVRENNRIYDFAVYNELCTRLHRDVTQFDATKLATTTRQELIKQRKEGKKRIDTDVSNKINDLMCVSQARRRG